MMREKPITPPCADSGFDLPGSLTAARLKEWRSLPHPGRGATAERHRRLAELGQEDLSLARLGEAHTDALAILGELDRKPASAGLYGVWASDGPSSRLTLRPVRAGSWRLTGVKQYCSGASLTQGALVTAHRGDELWLIEIPLASRGIEVQPSSWKNPAFADTVTATVRFTDVEVSDSQLIGLPGWYLSRPGFWHGAIGPAACWAGGALALIEAALQQKRADPHSQAHRGALMALSWSLKTLLEKAGREIDQDPMNRSRQARVRALMTRHLVERQATEVMDRFGRLTGPALLAFDAQCARQYSALGLYLRQCHAERDLETLGGDAF